MAEFDESWSENPWNHPADPYPLTRRLPKARSTALLEGNKTEVGHSAIDELSGPPGFRDSQLADALADALEVDDALAELAKDPSQMKECSEETDVGQNADSAIDELFRPPGFRDSQIPGSRDSEIPGFRMSSRVDDAAGEHGRLPTLTAVDDAAESNTANELLHATRCVKPRTVQAVPHPPPCPPPAHLLIAQAHGGTNDASLGRKSKAPPSNRY